MHGHDDLVALQPRYAKTADGTHIAYAKHPGLAVTIGARVAGLAGPSEVLVAQTVKDLVAGSGLGFEPRGGHELKGVPDRWRLYRASARG
jgi:class 3 adenylate cyclase